MPESVVFPSSFDSTRYTAVHGRDNYPNLAQAQAEAVTNLLLGRSLGLVNSYVLDSRTVLNLMGAIKETRESVYKDTSTAGRERIDGVNPFILRWYAPNKERDFFSCCANQLLRLEGQGRLLLSFWKNIDDNDAARRDLAAAFTSARPVFPESIREVDDPGEGGVGELERAFETLVWLDRYSRQGQGRGAVAGQSHTPLIEYINNFESLDEKGLEDLAGGGIDIDTVAHLRESIQRQDPAVKGARSWAHRAVEAAGGEEHCGIFLLQQRQLIDTLYNKVLADTTDAQHGLLSSVPRTVGNRGLEEVNALALNLIRLTMRRRGILAAADGTRGPDRFDTTPDMSELFVPASAVRDLPSAPLKVLLTAYWELVADGDRWPAWRQSCDRLERALRRALDLRSRGLADAQLIDAWQGHLTLLEDVLAQNMVSQGKLVASIEVPGGAYSVVSGPGEIEGDSLAAAQYIDQYLKGAFG
jgi:hypothetical protein